MFKLPIEKSKGPWKKGKNKKMNETRYKNPKKDDFEKGGQGSGRKKDFATANDPKAKKMKQDIADWVKEKESNVVEMDSQYEIPNFMKKK